MKYSRHILILLVLCNSFLIETCLAENNHTEITGQNSLISEAELNKLHQDENTGVKYFKKGKYKQAFEKLKLPAENGLKQAQYLVGFMYLRGDHVQRSILEGMGWLGVATEMGVDDWKKTFDGVYNAANKAQKQAIDTKVKTYVQLYGIETQKLICLNRSRAGSRRTQIDCHKRSKSQLDRIVPVN